MIVPWIEEYTFLSLSCARSKGRVDLQRDETAMRIEFLEIESSDCPLIRLYSFECETVRSLQKEVTRLADEAGRICRVHSLSKFRALASCTLTFISSSEDEPVQRMGRSFDFEWRLTPAGWLDIAGLMEPFVRNPVEGTYQWLSRGKAIGDIAVLFSYSTDGHW